MSQARAMELLREGIVAARAGDRARTRELLKEATTLDPSSEVAWLWYAGVADDPRDTWTYLQKVLQINPINQRALAAIKTTRLQAGIAYAKANNRQTARMLLTQVIAEEPQNELALMWLAGVTDAPAEAIRLLERVLEINPRNERARAGIEYYRTLLPANEAVAKKPAWQCPFCHTAGNERPSRCSSCGVFLRHQDLDAILKANVDERRLRTAMEQFKKRLGPNADFDTHYHLALGWLHLKALDDALLHFEEAARLRPNDESLERTMAEIEERSLREMMGASRSKPISEPSGNEVADLAPATPRVSPSAPIPVTPEPLRPNGNRRRILVVDPSPTLRRLISASVGRLPIRVMEACDGKEGMERISEEGVPDLVVLDIASPQLDGYKFCKALRCMALTKKTPIIALTSRDSLVYKMRSTVAGVSRYLPKPFHPTAFLGAVEQLCNLEGPNPSKKG